MNEATGIGPVVCKSGQYGSASDCMRIKSYSDHFGQLLGQWRGPSMPCLAVGRAPSCVSCAGGSAVL
jgi:hypothetical protein